MLVLRGNPHTCQSLLSLRLDREDRSVFLPPPCFLPERNPQSHGRCDGSSPSPPPSLLLLVLCDSGAPVCPPAAPLIVWPSSTLSPWPRLLVSCRLGEQVEGSGGERGGERGEREQQQQPVMCGSVELALWSAHQRAALLFDLRLQTATNQSADRSICPSTYDR